MSAMLYVRHSHICRASAKADYLFRSTVPYILTTCQTLTLIYIAQLFALSFRGGSLHAFVVLTIRSRSSNETGGAMDWIG